MQYKNILTTYTRMPTFKSQGFRMKETYTFIIVLVNTGAQHVCLSVVGLH